MNRLSALKRGWIRAGERIGTAVSSVLFTIIFFLFFGLLRLFTRCTVKNGWQTKKLSGKPLDDLRRQF